MKDKKIQFYSEPHPTKEDAVIIHLTQDGVRRKITVTDIHGTQAKRKMIRYIAIALVLCVLMIIYALFSGR